MTDRAIGKLMLGEMSAKIMYKRSAKGPVQIPQCGADGSYVQLLNTGSNVSPDVFYCSITLN